MSTLPIPPPGVRPDLEQYRRYLISLQGPQATVSAAVYTPTVTLVTNVAAATAYACQYLRVGGVVTVSGKVDLDPTAGASFTQLGISLPLASSFGSAQQCGGTAVAPAVAGYGAAIVADVAHARAELQFTTGADVANRSWWFSFTYQLR